MGLIIGVLLCIFSLVFLTGCNSEYRRSGIASSETVFESGVYLVGEDIPAGAYFVEAKENHAYIEVSTDRAVGVGTIFYDNVSTHRFVEVTDGQYLKVRNGRFVPIEDTPKLVSSDAAGEGMFRVGLDIPAGEFLVRATHRTVSAYVKVATSINSTPDDLVTNYRFKGERWITLEDGQYLTLNLAVLMLN